MLSDLPTTLPRPAPIPVRDAVDRATFEREIVPAYTPVVLKGQVADWPVVRAAQQGDAALVDLLKAGASERPLETFIGRPEIGGRFFYNDAVNGLNFERQAVPLGTTLDRLLAERADPQAGARYVGAASATDCMPGFEASHVLPIVDTRVLPRLWIGNATTVSTHYDLSDNVACVGAGRRRFTLFPPNQLNNLYVGPLDFTLAGQPVSMVSLRDPDMERFPRFSEAMAHALTAELEPGDALYIPPLWWHQVEALSPLNLLVNYWWTASGAPPSPFEALIHSVMTVRALPAAQREAWRQMFDHYVFEANGDPAAHLPAASRGVLGPMTPTLARRITDFLMAGLRRTGM
ncbi:MAG: cupin-like domain-containing protein [Brevundimonas sp.]|uniref:cupin-like domain-containing protein n=1 Tax=Brevundimonas sp. TaxID=1871086 RepID=UPI0027356662|nr:cupin-like domain-containing protein [Brevundimonas sp.]MDP3404167.1 cupin-like domain-containing protein [Brevundimonas sp.]